MSEVYATVWDAMCDTPEQAEAMRVRSDALTAVAQKVRSWNVTQRVAAGRLGVTQPRLNDLLNGRLSKFSLDALVELSAKAGLRPGVLFVEDEQNSSLTNEFFARLSPHIAGKPVSMDDLRKAVDKALGRRRTERRRAMSSYEEFAGLGFRTPSPAPKRVAKMAASRSKK
jgi:predicted XRE-type DNA-binding protein